MSEQVCKKCMVRWSSKYYASCPGCYKKSIESGAVVKIEDKPSKSKSGHAMYNMQEQEIEFQNDKMGYVYKVRDWIQFKVDSDVGKKMSHALTEEMKAHDASKTTLIKEQQDHIETMADNAAAWKEVKDGLESLKESEKDCRYQMNRADALGEENELLWQLIKMVKK